MEIEQLKAREKKAKTDLAALNAKPSLARIRETLDQVVRERELVLSRCVQVRDTSSRVSNVVGVSTQEREMVEREWKAWQGQVVRRRRICRELWGKCCEVLSEGGGTSREELWVSICPKPLTPPPP